jgi:hypothetical protein
VIGAGENDDHRLSEAAQDPEVGSAEKCFMPAEDECVISDQR